MPLPVTRPMRALISWMAHIKGQLNNMTQPMSKPNWAPTWL